MKRKQLVKSKIYILLAFLLITIALLIVVSIYCYLIKYRVKQSPLLPFHDTNNELRELYFNKCIMKMESNDKLKEADGANRMCSYFDHITEIE